MAEEKKWEDYETHIKVLAVLGLLTYVVFFGFAIWNIIDHLLNQEYFKAVAFASFFLTGHFSSAARNRKRKIKRLEKELAELKETRQTIEKKVLEQAFQAGVDFQRQVLKDWVEQKTGQKL